MAHSTGLEAALICGSAGALKGVAQESISPPPGLENAGAMDFTHPTGLHGSGLSPPPGDFSRANLGMTLEQQHQMNMLNEQLKLENLLLTQENALLRSQLVHSTVQRRGNQSCTEAHMEAYENLEPLDIPVCPDPMEPLKVNTEPLMKPPGVFKPGLWHEVSTISCASTAATDIGEVGWDEELCSDRDGPTSEAPAGRLDAARELRIEHLGSDGHLNVRWPVDARKLRGKDKQIISSSFEILPGVAFKMMLKPKFAGNRKGQASFQKARGWGSVELKFVEGVASAPALRFRVSVGQEQPRGPVECDFGSGTVWGLPKGIEDFDFASAVEASSSTFVVSLEIIPRDATSSIVDA